MGRVMSRSVIGSTGRFGVILLASSVFGSVSYVACGSPERSFTDEPSDASSSSGGRRDSGPDVSVGGHAGSAGGNAGSGGATSGSGGGGTGGEAGVGGDLRDTGVDDAPTTGI
jgi:hypothetical protein